MFFRPVIRPRPGVSRNSSEFKIVREFNGNLLTQEYRGTVSGSDLKLTVSGDRVGPMDVVFKKQ
jgi:hypothetical protein